MKSLISFSISRNALNGTLSTVWGSSGAGVMLKSLAFLDVSQNQMTGSLPASWSNISLLQQFIGDNNRLNGTLPASWSTLGLISILLANNQLQGLIPTSWATFSYVWLDNNCFIKPYPTMWPSFNPIGPQRNNCSSGGSGNVAKTQTSSTTESLSDAVSTSVKRTLSRDTRTATATESSTKSKTHKTVTAISASSLSRSVQSISLLSRTMSSCPGLVQPSILSASNTTSIINISSNVVFYNATDMLQQTPGESCVEVTLAWFLNESSSTVFLLSRVLDVLSLEVEDWSASATHAVPNVTWSVLTSASSLPRQQLGSNDDDGSQADSTGAIATVCGIAEGMTPMPGQQQQAQDRTLRLGVRLRCGVTLYHATFDIIITQGNPTAVPATQAPQPPPLAVRRRLLRC